MLPKRARLVLEIIALAAAGIIATIVVWRLTRQSGPRALDPDRLRAELEALRKLADIKERGAAVRAQYRIESDKAARKDEAIQSQIRDALADPDEAAGRRRLIAIERELFGDGDEDDADADPGDEDDDS